MDVFAHEVDLLLAAGLIGVDGDFGWGQGEDQPSETDVNVRQLQNVSKEDFIRLSVRAVENHMCAVDHAVAPVDIRNGRLGEYFDKRVGEFCGSGGRGLRFGRGRIRSNSFDPK